MALAYYKSATINHLQVGATNSTNFPLTVARDGNVQVADTDLKTVANGGFVQSASGFDIRPYSDSALTTALTYELVYYQATTGKLEMHIKIPTLSASVDTVIYLAFGDSTITTDGSSATTWDANFKGVWHLPDGTTLTANDSTSNANNGTISGASATTGKIDGGGSFNGTTNYIDTGTTGIPTTGTMTIQAWVNFTGGLDKKVLARWDDGPPGFDWLLDIGTDTVSFYARSTVGSPNVYSSKVASPSTGVWYHLVGTSDGANNVILYVNGVAGGASTGAFSNGADSSKVTIGAGQNGASRTNYFGGTIDEVRISNSVRSADWITAEYNSQIASSTLITWGTKTATGTTVNSNFLAFM